MKARITHLVTIVLLGLVWSSMALAKGALSDTAQQHFDAGVAYVDDPSGSKWEEALKEFRAAYADSPTWKLMNNIGLCALNLERDGEAIDAYKEYLAHGGEKDLSAKARKQIEKDIAMLTASLVRVTVEVEPGDATLVDERKNSKGELLVNRYPVAGGKASLGLHPGHHKVSIEAPGFVSAEWSFEADPSSTHAHQFKLEPEQQPETAAPAVEPVPVQPTTTNLDLSKPTPKRNLTGVYVGLAATGVFAVAATVTGVVTMGKKKDFDNASNPAEEDSLRKSGKTFALLTDIGMGAAIVSAGVTAYLYFSAPKAEAPKTGKAKFNVSPMAGRNSAGLAISGNF